MHNSLQRFESRPMRGHRAMRVCKGKAGRGGLPLLYVVKSMSMQVESPSPVSVLRAGMGIGFLPSPTDGLNQVVYAS